MGWRGEQRRTGAARWDRKLLRRRVRTNAGSGESTQAAADAAQINCAATGQRPVHGREGNRGSAASGSMKSVTRRAGRPAQGQVAGPAADLQGPVRAGLQPGRGDLQGQRARVDAQREQPLQRAWVAAGRARRLSPPIRMSRGTIRICPSSSSIAAMTATSLLCPSSVDRTDQAHRLVRIDVAERDVGAVVDGPVQRAVVDRSPGAASPLRGAAVARRRRVPGWCPRPTAPAASSVRSRAAWAAAR